MKIVGNKCLWLGCAIFLSTAVFAQQKMLNVFALDRDALVINKKKVLNHDKQLMPALERLKEDADKLLDKPLLTVMEKKQLPPSGDKHDYMSLAIYYWPDPSKPDGLPYIRKDGQINPEVGDYKDKSNIMNMCELVQTLSLAYYFTDDSRYARKAVEQLRAWFLDRESRMNPNFNFAQAVKGKNDGRGTGLIESRELISVIDGIGLLQNSVEWTKEDQQGMEKWFENFLQWMITSKNGIDEYQTKNNHGIWYDAQKLSYAIFSHKDEIAKNTITSLKSRIESQMDTTGFFPAEMERTISLHYSAFVIEPLFKAANMSLAVGEDLWNYSTPTGKSLKKAFNVVMPYLSKEKEWTWQQIKPFEFSANATPLLAQGAYRFHCITCKDAINRVYDKKPEQTLLHLTTLID